MYIRKPLCRAALAHPEPHRGLDWDPRLACKITDNTTYLCAYDAYFGRYEVDAAAGIVVHILDGSLALTDVGRRLTRRFRVAGDTLTIQFEVRGPGGRQGHSHDNVALGQFVMHFAA